VVDYGAVADPYHLIDDTQHIQDAIDDDPRRQILVPAGDYVVNGQLRLANDGQRVTFLAGAMLRLNSDAASVIITGKSQAPHSAGFGTRAHFFHSLEI
jgi:polygalacturonase